MLTGRIVKGVGGLYQVDVNGEIYKCKAKGVMRNKKIKPVIGDICSIEVSPQISDHEGIIFDISERKNEIIRPRVSNVDQVIIIMSADMPEIDLNLLDRYLVILENNNYEIIICINKIDLQQDESIFNIKKMYEKIGYKVIMVSALCCDGINLLKDTMKHKVSVFAGPSGVGKSSITNCLLEGSVMETGEVSEKISRGKHTTRHVQLLKFDEDTYFFDTPGFTSLEFLSLDPQKLDEAFIEMRPFIGQCYYRNCNHINEPDCSVKEQIDRAVEPRRYENYVKFYDELKQTHAQW